MCIDYDRIKNVREKVLNFGVIHIIHRPYY